MARRSFSEALEKSYLLPTKVPTCTVSVLWTMLYICTDLRAGARVLSDHVALAIR